MIVVAEFYDLPLDLLLGIGAMEEKAGGGRHHPSPPPRSRARSELLTLASGKSHGRIPPGALTTYAGLLLRHLISYLATSEVAADYRRLMLDWFAWDHPQSRVQRQWGRSFWGGSADGRS